MRNRCIGVLFFFSCILCPFAKKFREIQSDNILAEPNLLGTATINNAIPVHVNNAPLVSKGKGMSLVSVVSGSNLVGTVNKNKIFKGKKITNDNVHVHVKNGALVSKGKVMSPVNVVSGSNLVGIVNKNKVFKGKKIANDSVLTVMDNLVEIEVKNNAYEADGKPVNTPTSKTVRTRKNFFGRMKDAIAGVVTGIVLYILAFPIVTIGEGTFVHREYVIKKVKKAFLKEEKAWLKAKKKEMGKNFDPKLLPPEPMEVTIEGEEEKTVHHLCDNLETEEEFHDPIFKVKAKEKSFLYRKVEMYQYFESSTQEKKKYFGGSETTDTTYNLREGWFETPQDNPPHFKDNTNPPFPSIEEKKLGSQTFFPHDLMIKKTLLSESQKKKVEEQSEVHQMNLQDIDGTYIEGEGKALEVSRKGFTLETPVDGCSSFIIGAAVGDDEPSLKSPKVGTIRISFHIGVLEQYTLICAKEENKYAPYKCDNIKPYSVPYLCCGCCLNYCVRKYNEGGCIIDWCRKGEWTVKEMFTWQKQINRRKRFAIHSVGFFMFFFGIALILHPISVFFDTMGFIGFIVKYNMWLGAFLIGTVSYLLTMTFVWFYYRPMYAGGLFISSIAIIVLIAKVTPHHHT